MYWPGRTLYLTIIGTLTSLRHFGDNFYLLHQFFTEPTNRLRNNNISKTIRRSSNRTQRVGIQSRRNSKRSRLDGRTRQLRNSGTRHKRWTRRHCRGLSTNHLLIRQLAIHTQTRRHRIITNGFNWHILNKNPLTKYKNFHPTLAGLYKVLLAILPDESK